MWKVSYLIWSSSDFLKHCYLAPEVFVLQPVSDIVARRRNIYKYIQMQLILASAWLKIQGAESLLIEERLNLDPISFNWSYPQMGHRD